MDAIVHKTRVLATCRRAVAAKMAVPMATATVATAGMAMHEHGAVAPVVAERGCMRRYARAREGAAAAAARERTLVLAWAIVGPSGARRRGVRPRRRGAPLPPRCAPAAVAERRRGAMVATSAERRGGKRTLEQAVAHEQLQLRVNRVRYSLPFTSQVALGSILTLSAREELPVADRNRVRQSRDAAVRQETEYGMLHKTVEIEVNDGGEGIQMEIQNPQAMFAHMVKSNPSFARRVEAAYARRPPTRLEPWTITMYGDEILPGNALAHTTNRKCWGFYWSLLELGPCTLAKEDSPMGAQPSLHRWRCSSIFPVG